MAARQFFGEDIELVPARSFDVLIRQAADPVHADTAVMAIENSIAGSILGNYMLLQQHNLQITGEVYLRIEQHLMALPGVGLEQIREVHSHPMALAQCRAFLDQHPWSLVESADTAESAAWIAQKGLTSVAAIGSKLAAGLYGLDIVAPSIETNPANFTRFLALERRSAARAVPGANKASVSFSAPHQPGSLSAILTMLAADSANLTKIQSVPVPGKAWEYLFFIDFTVPNPAILSATLRLLDAMTTDLRVLGIYKSADPTPKKS
jgi:prephenate dehydratase